MSEKEELRLLVESWAGQPEDIIKLEDLVYELDRQFLQPLEAKNDEQHNQITHPQTQLRQVQQALEAAKTENYNAGVEAAAQLIEGNEQWFEGAGDHIRFAEEIRDLKE
ncbi:MAG: hypothetical protein JWP00_1497 [Chloroflexi bacterium]|nr:hypothetical protein [Chloroflexota bacterium]